MTGANHGLPVSISLAAAVAPVPAKVAIVATAPSRGRSAAVRQAFGAQARPAARGAAAIEVLTARGAAG